MEGIQQPTYEIEMRHQDGSIRWLEVSEIPVRDEHGNVAAVEGVAHDVTARKEAENALHVSEERYRTLFEHSRDAIMTLAPPSWKYTSANPATVEMFGAKDEAHFTSLAPWEVSPETQPDACPSAEKAMEIIETAMREGSHFFEWTHKRLSGEEFPATVLLSRMEWSGAPMLQATVRDISERKSLEMQFQQSQKMEAIGQLAGGVAHDFNNLLQAIMGYGEIALEESKGRSTHSDLEQVMNAAERATKLVRQLLAFSRKQVLELEDIDLGEVVSDLAKMIQRVIGEHIAFNILSEPGLKSIRADKGQIEQVLMNLCVNARDAMADCGTLTIETGNTELDEEFCEVNTWAKPGRYVVLSVADTGCGMDDETQRRIFEPFFTTKELGKGTGLGLSTVFGIVRQHNGMVHIYSEVGVGTAFRIYLPMVEGAEAADEEEATAPPRGGTETILLADDDEGVRGAARRMLEKAGYTVLAASDGEEAIRVFDEHADEIDLALLDVVMPKLGGKAVAEHIRRERPEARVLFSSGYSTDAIHTNFALDDKMQIIQKPYQRGALLRKIREVLDS